MTEIFEFRSDDKLLPALNLYLTLWQSKSSDSEWNNILINPQDDNYQIKLEQHNGNKVKEYKGKLTLMGMINGEIVYEYCFYDNDDIYEIGYISILTTEVDLYENIKLRYLCDSEIFSIADNGIVTLKRIYN